MLVFFASEDTYSVSKIRVNSPDGKGFINISDKDMPAIQITELGQVQIRVHFPDKGIWIKYNIGKLNGLLPDWFEINYETHL